VSYSSVWAAALECLLQDEERIAQRSSGPVIGELCYLCPLLGELAMTRDVPLCRA
jgi:hypothetical protein